MPILELEYVTGADAQPTPGLAQAVADAAAVIFETPPGSTWVKLRSLAQENYAENGAESAADLAPVFLRVLLAAPPEGERLASCARQLADAVAKCMGRSANQVHILFEPAALGRIAFGGVLRQ